MKKTLINLRNNTIWFFYKKIFRKIFFKMDEEKVHENAIRVGRFLGSNIFLRKATSFFFAFSDPALKQTICGIKFKNPVGMAAGFDKNAEIIKINPSIGFGFTEVGSITGQPCPGNLKPRLWRLPKSKSIVVNYGLNNQGAENISKRLVKDGFFLNPGGLFFGVPLGISVAKTNSKETVNSQKGIEDYLKVISIFKNIGDYFSINISCPNAYGGRPFAEPSLLDKFLLELSKLNINKPVFIKIPPDLTKEALDKIINLADRYKIDGFVCSNLTKNRDGFKIAASEINIAPEGIGGISGKPIEEMTNKLIAEIHKKTKGEKIIIGCGGIFNAEDAYKKIKLGASLLQLITGMIFEGPQVVSQINLGICRLLKRDGFKNISEAVGIDVNK